MIETPTRELRAFDSAVACTACGSIEAAAQIFASYGFDNRDERFDIVRCRTCGLARTSPFPDTAQLASYYSASYYGDGNRKKFFGPVEWFAQSENRQRAGNLEKHGARSGRVLDIGCGRAGFLKALQARAHDCYGLEIPGFPLAPSEPGLTLFHGEPEMLGFEGAFFDAVSIWHVLEHTQNPSKVLREISRVLKPGGVLALAVPNFGSTQARLFGKNWFHLDLPRHLFHFTEPMLTKMLRDTGLEPVRVSTHSIHQNLYGFIQSLLNGLFPRTPNKLFNFLKGGNKKESSLAGMLPHLAVASSAFPLAVLETVWSGVSGSGASLIIYARKKD